MELGYKLSKFSKMKCKRIWFEFSNMLKAGKVRYNQKCLFTHIQSSCERTWWKHPHIIHWLIWELHNGETHLEKPFNCVEFQHSYRITIVAIRHTISGQVQFVLQFACLNNLNGLTLTCHLKCRVWRTSSFILENHLRKVWKTKNKMFP